MEMKCQVDTIYTDVKAAFDRVNHEILLAKLDKLGCSIGLCQWLRSYLTDRQIYVAIDSYESTRFTNKSGVPQGSNLGPLLFSIFINDVTCVLPNGCILLYADDLKIFLVIRKLEDCLELQRMLDSLADWCARNLMLLSLTKCFVISFSRSNSAIKFDYKIGDTTLERVDHIKDLGVILDEQLSYKLHYAATVDKANRTLGFVFKIAEEFRDVMCFKALYCSLVRPILEFASVVWSPYHAIWDNRFEAVQRKFLRYSLRHLPWRDPVNLPPYESRCQLLNIDTLSNRRRIFQIIFIAKLLNNEYDAPDLLSLINIYAPTRTLRPRALLQQESRNTVYGSNSPMLRMIRHFNVAADVFEFGQPSSTFRRQLWNTRM